MSTLWSFKGYILHAAVVLIGFLDPSVRAFFAANPMYAMIGLAAWGGILHWANGKVSVSPKAVASVIALFFLLVVPGFLRAQAAPSTVTTGALGTYQIGAGYTSVGGPTDNGTLLTFSKAFSPRVWGTVKTYMLANPSGVVITSIGPRYRPPLSAIWKASSYFDTTKFFPFVDADLGVVKDPTGHDTFAYGIGAGLDYQVAPNVTLLMIQADYYRSKFFPSGGLLVSNVHTIATGLKFTF